MSDGDWDLHAVVRSCTATRAVVDNNMEEEERKQPLPDYYFRNDYVAPYSYPDQTDNVRYGLEEIYESVPNINTDFENEEVSHQPQLHAPQSNDYTLPIPVPQSSTIGSRRRKNQHLKMVYQMTQEELSGDTWAWRKYGQKPIKGSPYPSEIGWDDEYDSRNYYRCSTLKGCAARKQVERSPMDPTIFIVSYTSEHAHPRPTHRSSLAGSTRNKFSATAALNSMIKSTASGESSSIAPNYSPSTSPSSALTFSPPLFQGENNQDINAVDDIEMVDIDEDCREEAFDCNDDDNNLVSNEEMFQELPEFDANSHFFD